MRCTYVAWGLAAVLGTSLAGCAMPLPGMMPFGGGHGEATAEQEHDTPREDDKDDKDGYYRNASLDHDAFEELLYECYDDSKIFDFDDVYDEYFDERCAAAEDADNASSQEELDQATQRLRDARDRVYEKGTPALGFIPEYPPDATEVERSAIREAYQLKAENEYAGYGRLIDAVEVIFDHETAVYGVDHCGIDWNEDAMSFARWCVSEHQCSEDVLYQMLLIFGYTDEQANYAKVVASEAGGAATPAG